MAVKERECAGYAAFVHAARQEPSLQPLVAANYLDGNLDDAIQRFLASDEFGRTVELLGLKGDKRVLDFGAGRGIAAFAFASLGCRSVALDLNENEVCGITAIPRCRRFATTPILAVQGDSEQMPFPDDTFDLVYCRHVLHHAFDLSAMVREAVRVLKPAGVFMAVGEHTRPLFARGRDFVAAHPAAAYGANEQVFSVLEYRAACHAAGLGDVRLVYPLTDGEFVEHLRRAAERDGLRRLATILIRAPIIGRTVKGFLYWLWRIRLDYFNHPGREVTLLARKRLRIT